MEPLQPSSALFVYSIFPALFLCVPYTLITSIVLNLYDFFTDDLHANEQGDHPGASMCTHPTLVFWYLIGTLVYTNVFLFYTLSIILLSPIRCFHRFLSKIAILLLLIFAAASGAAFAIYAVIIPDISNNVPCRDSVLFINAVAGTIVLILIVGWAVLTIMLSQLHQLCWCCCKRRSDVDDRLRMQKATAQRKHQEWLLRSRTEEDRLFGYVRRPGDMDASDGSKRTSSGITSTSPALAATFDYGKQHGGAASASQAMRHSAPPPSSATSAAEDKDVIRPPPREQAQATDARNDGTPTPPARHRTGSSPDSSEDEELDVHANDSSGSDADASSDRLQSRNGAKKRAGNARVHDEDGDEHGNDNDDEPRTPRPTDLPLDHDNHAIARTTTSSSLSNRRVAQPALSPLPVPRVAPHATRALGSSLSVSSATATSPDAELLRLRELRERLTREQFEREQYLERERQEQARAQLSAQIERDTQLQLLRRQREERERQASTVDKNDMPLFGGDYATMASAGASTGTTGLRSALPPAPTSSSVSNEDTRAARIEQLRQQQLALSSASAESTEVESSKARDRGRPVAPLRNVPPLQIESSLGDAAVPFDLDSTPTEFVRSTTNEAGAAATDVEPERIAAPTTTTAATAAVPLTRSMESTEFLESKYDEETETVAGGSGGGMRHSVPADPVETSLSLAAPVSTRASLVPIALSSGVPNSSGGEADSTIQLPVALSPSAARSGSLPPMPSRAQASPLASLAPLGRASLSTASMLPPPVAASTATKVAQSAPTSVSETDDANAPPAPALASSAPAPPWTASPVYTQDAPPAPALAPELALLAPAPPPSTLTRDEQYAAPFPSSAVESAGLTAAGATAAPSNAAPESARANLDSDPGLAETLTTIITPESGSELGLTQTGAFAVQGV